MPTLALRGACGMAITPFTPGGAIDEAALRIQLRYMAERGAGIFLGAINSGEGDLLTPEEMRQLYRVAVDELKGVMPVYAAASEPYSTEWMIERVKEAADLGCAGTQLYPLRPPTQPPPADWEAQAERFFHTVLEAARVPIFLCNYNHGGPGRVSSGLVLRLVNEYPQIVGVNVGSGPSVVKEIVEGLPRKIPVRGGNLYENLMAGGDGNLGTEANVIPRMFSQVVELAKGGKPNEAKTMFDRTAPFCAFMGKHSNPRDGAPRNLKPMLNRLGFKVGVPRRSSPPPLDGAALREMDEMMEQMDIRGFERV